MLEKMLLTRIQFDFVMFLWVWIVVCESVNYQYLSQVEHAFLGFSFGHS